MPNQPKTRARSLRIPDDVAAGVTAVAKREGQTFTDVVVLALRQHFGCWGLNPDGSLRVDQPADQR